MRSRTLAIASFIAAVIIVISATPGLGCGNTGGAGAGLPSTSATIPAGPTTTMVHPTMFSTPADKIIQRMSLRQKAAQTLLLTFAGRTLQPDAQQLIEAGPPGGVLITSENMDNAGQLQTLTSALQQAAAAAGPRIGLFVAVDQEGGSEQPVFFETPVVPGARTLAEGSTTTGAIMLADQTAAALLKLGINMNLAPVADVVSDTASALYGRSYAGDPTVVIDFVQAVTGAYARAGLISVVGHFPGQGNAPGDPHSQMIVSGTGQADLANVHLRPFKVALAAGAEGILMSHAVVTTYDPDHPASSSSRIIKGVLRTGLGFAGVVVCDDIQMVAAAGSTTAQSAGARTSAQTGEIAVQALNAGCDLLLCSGEPADQLAVLDAIEQAVKTGRLSEQRLNEAVSHMLAVKLRHGLVS